MADNEVTPATLPSNPKLSVATYASSDSTLAQPSQGWRPAPWLAYLMAAIGGGLASAVPFVSGPGLVVVTVAMGVFSAVAAAMGIASAGAKR